MTAKELVNEALAEVRKANALKAGKIKQVEKDCVAYNVEDTTGEPRPTGEGQNWDDYWKYWTNEKFTDATCACCGCALNDDIRVGAHVRLKGEPDNTKDAWIALYCKGCNNPGSGGTDPGEYAALPAIAAPRDKADGHAFRPSAVSPSVESEMARYSLSAFENYDATSALGALLYTPKPVGMALLPMVVYLPGKGELGELEAQLRPAVSQLSAHDFDIICNGRMGKSDV